MLGDRHRSPNHVGLLEGVSANQCGTNLSGDDDDWYGVKIGICQGRHHVHSRRARGDDCAPNPSTSDSETFGRVARPLFMSNQDVADA